jgi:hypothetical protein
VGGRHPRPGEPADGHRRRVPALRGRHGGLLAWGTTIATGLRTRLPRLPGFVVEGLAVSFAAQVATLSIVLLTFGRLAPCHSS